jgi:hypothetical protein
MKLSHVKIGDRVIVRNGARGEQIAFVASIPSDDSLRVHKWLMRGKRWTNRVTVYSSEVLRYASLNDLARRRVNVTSPIGN